MNGWSFQATARELQFLIVGIALGVIIYATCLGLGFAHAGGFFIIFVFLIAAFFFLAAVRDITGRRY